MSLQMEKNGARPVSIDRLLRVQNKIDIIFNDNLFRDQADVRESRVLEVNSKVLVLAQTSPPVLKSMINKTMEATCVNFDMVTSQRSRWGWESRILGLNNEYIPEDAPPDTPPAQAVFIALPGRGALRSSNVRMDYRLAVTSHDGIALSASPSISGAKLLNFSAGGVLIAAPGPPQLRAGTPMHVALRFPWPDSASPTSIKSKAELVRVDYARGDQATRLGIHFQEMNADTRRDFHKIINHYMLAEQRRNNTKHA